MLSPTNTSFVILLSAMLAGCGGSKSTTEALPAQPTEAKSLSATSRSKTSPTPPETLAQWEAAPALQDALAPAIAVGPYSIRPPKGWSVASATYRRQEADIVWKGSDQSVRSRFQFTVTLGENMKISQRPRIHTKDGMHGSPELGTHDFGAAPAPTLGTIGGVEFSRVYATQNVRGQHTTFDAYIAVLDGATIKIETDVWLQSDADLCQVARAAALSFNPRSTVPPVLNLETLSSSGAKSTPIPGL